MISGRNEALAPSCLMRASLTNEETLCRRDVPGPRYFHFLSRYTIIISYYFSSLPLLPVSSDLCPYMCLKPGSIWPTDTQLKIFNTHGPWSIKEINKKWDSGKCSLDPSVKLMRLSEKILALND